jgi:hypothetical protein
MRHLSMREEGWQSESSSVNSEDEKFPDSIRTRLKIIFREVRQLGVATTVPSPASTFAPACTAVTEPRGAQGSAYGHAAHGEHYRDIDDAASRTASSASSSPSSRSHPGAARTEEEEGYTQGISAAANIRELSASVASFSIAEVDDADAAAHRRPYSVTYPGNAAAAARGAPMPPGADAPGLVALGDALSGFHEANFLQAGAHSAPTIRRRGQESRAEGFWCPRCGHVFAIRKTLGMHQKRCLS